MFRKKKPATLRTSDNAPAKEEIPFPESGSPFLIGLARALNETFRGEHREQLSTTFSDIARTTETEDEVRAHMALDWSVRVWFPKWLVFVQRLSGDISESNSVGDQVSEQLTSLPHIVDVQTAGQAGSVISFFEGLDGDPVTKYVESHSRGFVVDACAAAARKVGPQMLDASSGPAFVHAAASVAPEMCSVARTQVALDHVSTLALAVALDKAYEMCERIAPRTTPDTIASQLHMFAPMGAERELDRIVTPLQDSAMELFRRLVFADTHIDS